jgi:hypothetical protein
MTLDCASHTLIHPLLLNDPPPNIVILLIRPDINMPAIDPNLRVGSKT